MTLILMLATAAVLTFLGLSCRRARLDLEEQICECLHPEVPVAVGFGGPAAEVRPAGPVLTRIDGREAACLSTGEGRHLRVVRAG